MADRTLRVAQELAIVWERLQQLETWEGIGGMGQLRDPLRDDQGSLRGFRYSLNTLVGAIDDTADVTSSLTDADDRRMQIVTETKGVRVTIELVLSGMRDKTFANFTIDAQATNFIARPLASSLRQTLDSGIIRESDRIVERLEASTTT